MTTARQAARLLKPLLARHPDLSLSGRSLWIRPVGHFVRRLSIGSTFSADRFQPIWDLKATYRPRSDGFEGYGLNRGCLARPGTGQNWSWDEPDLAEALFAVIEGEILPWLRAIDTFEAYVAFAQADPVTGPYQGQEWHLLTHIALGDLDAARAIWAMLAPRYEPGAPTREPCWHYEDARLARLGPPLLAGDRAGLARLLHAWEAEMITGDPLRADWRATPFPLERGA